MEDIKAKVQAIVDKYALTLSENGIMIRIAKRYCEEAVDEDTRDVHQSGILNSIVDSITTAFAKKEEKTKGYNHIRNRYHCIVLTVTPLEKSLVPKDRCKEYSFFLKKIERLHIGLNPEKYVYKEGKLLKKVEKRILKLLRYAQSNTPKKACSDTIIDAFRYSSFKKYKYKKKILGKDIYFWRFFNLAAYTFLALLTILVLFLIFH